MSFEGRSMRARCHGCLRPTPRKTRLYRLGGRVDWLTRSRRVQNRRRNVTSTPPCDSDSPSAAAVTASPSDSEIKAAATADSDSKEKVEEADSPCDSEIKAAAAADYDSKEKAEEEEADSQSNHFFVKCSISTAATCQQQQLT